MTAGKTLAALPDFVAGKPRIVQGAGMLNGLVYGYDENGEWYFNGSGERPPADAKKNAAIKDDK